MFFISTSRPTPDDIRVCESLRPTAADVKTGCGGGSVWPRSAPSGARPGRPRPAEVEGGALPVAQARPNEATFSRSVPGGGAAERHPEPHGGHRAVEPGEVGAKIAPRHLQDGGIRSSQGEARR